MVDFRRKCLTIDFQVVAFTLQVYTLATMSTISAFTICSGLRPISRPLVPRLVESRIFTPRICRRTLRMGALPSGEPGNESKFNIFKILQQAFSSGKSESGETGRRRFLRIGLALAAPVIALETWKTMDPSITSKFQAHAQAQAGLLGSSVKIPIAESDSKLAPNEINTIR